ncbi:MAG: DMT family transporter [Paracoccaceae bacterium]
MKQNSFFGLGIAFLGALIISPDTLFMRWAEMTGFQMMAWRGFLASLGFFFIWFVANRGNLGELWEPQMLIEDLKGITNKWAIMIIFCQFCSTSFFSLGVSVGPVSLVLFGTATIPLFSAAFATILLKEILHKSTLITMITVMIGILIAIFGASESGIILNFWSLMGALCGLGVALTIAINFTIIRHKTELPFVLAIAIGTFFTGLLGFLLTGSENMNNGYLVPIFITGIFIIPVSYYLLSLASRYTATVNVSLILLLEVILGPIWVWMGVGEQPTSITIFGGFIVVLSLAIYLSYLKTQKDR